MIKLSLFKPVVLVALFAFHLGCTDDGSETPDETSSTSSDLTQIYEFHSYLNHRCMDILGLNLDNGAHVGMWDCWGGANQRWYWNGEEIRSLLDNKCLDVLGIDPNNGAHVGVWDCWGGVNQHWYWNGTEIRSRLNNKCLDVLGIDPNNGAHLGMWDCWGGANQQWYSPSVL